MSTDTIPIIVLTILYAIQAIPMGIFWGSMPYILSENPSFSYSDQAIFSLSSYPYSLKLLWSPIADSIYFKSLGRRKSWLFPSQNIMGILMIYISYHIDTWIQNININALTIWCFILIFFTATQDISVDGWALTILSKDNVHLQSTCQSFGMNVGYTIGFPVFLALNSDEICVKYFSSNAALLTLSDFFYISGIIMILISAIITLFIHEKTTQDEHMSICRAYSELWSIIKLRNVKELAFIMFTRHITFTCFDSVTGMKLQKQGFPKEIAGILVFIYVPIEMFNPLILRYLNNKTKLGSISYLMQWKYAYIFRIIIGCIGAWNVFTFELDENGNVFNSFILKLVIITIMYSYICSVQFMMECSFFSEIADPVIGAGYMTFLNTLSNFGRTWPKYFILKGVDYLTIENTIENDIKVIEYDGYYILMLLGSVYGIVWVLCTSSTLFKLDNLPKSTSWSILRKRKKTD